MASHNQGNNGRPGIRRLDDNVVMADFGARRRKEQHRKLGAIPKVPQIKESWAATELMEAVVRAADAGRIARGRDYFRAGHVMSTEAIDEEIVGWVSGSQLEPFEVRIRFPRIGDKDRYAVREQLSVHPDNVKFLMMGEKPLPAVADRLIIRTSRLGLRCSCPDPAQVCKHMVAVALDYSQKLSEDPLEILRLRGIDPRPFVATVQAERSESPIDSSIGSESQPAGEPEVSSLHSKDSQTRIVNYESFWGKDATSVPWEAPSVEEGLELGDQKHLMDALETISWTHVDQLEYRDFIDRCYEELGAVRPLFDYSRRMSDVHEINRLLDEERTQED